MENVTVEQNSLNNSGCYNILINGKIVGQEIEGWEKTEHIAEWLMSVTTDDLISLQSTNKCSCGKEGKPECHCDFDYE